MPHAKSESVRLGRRLTIQATMPLTAVAPSTRRRDRGVSGLAGGSCAPI